MIHLSEIEVRGQSERGAFLGSLQLAPGLQVISAPNSYGKSLAVTAIAWCLGIEQMFGLFDNDSSCFPLAAREEIELEGHPPSAVFSSECSIVVKNADGRELKLARDIKGDPTIVRVEERFPDGNVRRSKLMARKATMQDARGGLQHFLFEWLGWPRQQILNTKGASSEVYLENLAPLFYIDQDEGWTDLQSLQVGRYGQQQIAEIAFEYLLGAADAIKARVEKQLAVLREAALRESARGIADRITAFFLRHGWEANWTGYGSIQDTITRWSLRGLRDVLLQDANVDLVSRRKSLETQAEALRRALAADPVDPADASAASAVSQKVVDLKKRRHELNEELRTLRAQHTAFKELLTSLSHRMHAANDVLRLKTTGVGRFERAECPTCHRDLDPSTFSLTEQSEESVATHIDALKRDYELMSSNLQAIEARLTSTQAEFVRIEGELRDFERSLVTVNAAIGSLREQLAKTAVELTTVERRLDQVVEASAELDKLQTAVGGWLKEAKAAQQLGQHQTDLQERLEIFLRHLQEYLVALGHSALLASNPAPLHLDERYTPYLGTRRLRSLGSASDQSRLVAAYCLALAASSKEVTGFHPGIVVLDEPLQQNPDDAHRDLFNTFLSDQLARQSGFQTVVFTFIRDAEIARLRKQGTKVITPEGKHFLKIISPPAEAKSGDAKAAPEPVGDEPQPTTKMCSHCGESPALTLKITKHDPDLDGLGVGWPETLDVLVDNDIGDDPDFYFVTGFCSETCIHLSGEYRHALARDPD